MLNCLCGDGSSLSWAKSKEPVRAERSSTDPSEKWQHPRPFRDKRFFCLEVEPADGARPEVQATTIKIKGTPASNWSQWHFA